MVSDSEGSLDEDVDPVDESPADILKCETYAECGSTKNRSDGRPTRANNRQDHGPPDGEDGESRRAADQGRYLGVDPTGNCCSPHPGAYPVRDHDREQDDDEDLNCSRHCLSGLGFVQS
jgi:hypothetical protein